MALTEAQIQAMSDFNSTTAAALTEALGGLVAVQALSAAGAVNLTNYKTELSVSGTKAYTLAAPTVAGQKKKIVCVSAASTPAGTLTVSSPDTATGFVCPASFFFDAVGQEVEFEATAGLLWRCIAKKRVGYKTLVIGTTVTTGICNMSHILASVTATVASATTKGVPNGAAVGERLQITCSVAATTPHGDISGTFLDHLGAAKTGLDDFTVVGEGGTFVWTGAAWQLEGALTSTTLAFV